MVLLLVPVAVLLVAFVALAVSQQSHAWADAIVGWAFGWLAFLPFVGKAVEPAVVALAKWISAKLGNIYVAQVQHVVHWVSGLAAYVKFMADTALEWPTDLVIFARWLLTQEIPALVKSLPNAVTKVVHQTVTRVARVERTVVRVGHLTPAIVRAAVAAAFPGIALSLPSLRWLRKHWAQLAALLAAGAGAIALPWGGIGRIERRTLNLGKRLSKVEKLLGVSAFAAVLARVLQVSTRCLRDGNLGRGARQVCAADSSLITSLLGDLIAIVGVISVVEFAEALREIEGEAVAILAAGIREFPS